VTRRVLKIWPTADIDTLPLLAWHEDMVQHAPPAMTSILRYQQYIFFPILCFARMAWAQQSFSHALILSKVSRKGMLEVALISLHYAIVAGLALATMSLGKVLFFMLSSQVRQFQGDVCFACTVRGPQKLSL
jgi:hypothetical protein